MDHAEAETLMWRLMGAFDKVLSTQRKAMYIERLIAWPYEVGRRAVNHVVDSEERFPSLAKVLERCQHFGVQAVRPPDKDAEVILMPAQCARRRQRCLERIHRKVSREVMDEVRTLSDYNRLVIGVCEHELDWMSSVGYAPSVAQFDACLRNYYAVMTKLGAWYDSQCQPVPVQHWQSPVAELVAAVSQHVTIDDANEDV